MEPSNRPAECEWAQRELFEARPGQVPAERLQAHLARCPDCRKAQEVDRRLVALLHAAAIPATPATLQSRIGKLRNRRWVLQCTVGAAAAVLLIGLGTLAFWSPRIPTSSPGPVVVGPTKAEREVWNDVVVLGSRVPVVAVPPEQAAWLAVLNEACEGQKR